MKESSSISTGAIPAHGGRREEAARRYGLPKEEFLDFSASINLMGPPPAALAALRRSAAEIAHYPAERAAALAAALAERLGVAAAEVVPGNGSIEIIYWLALMLRPQRVLIVEPTFSEYRRACLNAGAACESHQLQPEDDFVLDPASLRPEAHDAVFMCNPNNPTGYLVPVDELLWLWKRCQIAGAALVLDEAFIDFAGQDASVLSRNTGEGLYVIRSLTKSHALAGLRLGCLVALPGDAARLRQMMPPWNVNAMAAAAGIAALEDDSYLHSSRRENLAARSRLVADLSLIRGIDPLPSEANFVLCRLDGIDSAEATDRLGRQGILVRDCRSFAGLGDRFIRVAVRSERENYQLISALRRVVGVL